MQLEIYYNPIITTTVTTEIVRVPTAGRKSADITDDWTGHYKTEC